MSLANYASLRSYVSYITTFKWRFFIVLIAYGGANLLLAVIPLFIGQLVGALTADQLDKGAIFAYAGFLIACSIGHDFTWHLGEMLYLKLINAKTYEYENVVFQQIIHKNYPYFVGKFTGKIGSYIGNLGREFRDLMNEVFVNYVEMLVKLPSIAVIMFAVHIYTGLIFTASIIIMYFVGRMTIRRSALYEKRLTTAQSDMDGYIIDVIANFVSVKAFKKERKESTVVVQRRGQVVDASNRAFFWTVLFWGSMGFIVRWLVWPGTILLNIHLFLAGAISVAQITTFFAAIVIFADYIWAVIWHLSQLNLQLARAEESYGYLFGKRNILKDFQKAERSKELAVPEFNQALALNNLIFAYPDMPKRPVLDTIAITIKKNEKIGIVGKSGSGKTTLVKLLLGYYRVAGNAMLLDGKAIDNRSLVQLISYVPQDTALFHRSIKENIAYGAQDTPDDAKIITAAQRAHAHEFIQQAPQGYDTEVGERGIKLSMGQRQRIAIARAFLDDKPILVLDEATSALDSESEVLVQQALEDLWAHKTVIAIAHRLSTLKHMDRIVVMSEGKIVEDGTHDDLLQKRGHYYRLWQHQSGGVIADE